VTLNRHAQAALLFLTGAALLHAGTTGLYLRYVKPGLQPLLLASGAVLIATAAATLWYERKQTRGETPDPHPHPQPQPSPHPHHEPGISWLLVLPLLALILVAPPALGSYSAMRTGTALQQPYGTTPLPPGRTPLHLTVVDYATRAVYDHGRSLTGRPLTVTGFVALDARGRPYLVRMALTCCAADAQPVKIALTGHVPPVLQPDTWLAVTGTYTSRRTTDPVNHRPIPYLRVTGAHPVPTPHDPYDETWNT
jgi:uncharacterized repeat protein (TIGR03943 family)